MFRLPASIRLVHVIEVGPNLAAALAIGVLFLGLFAFLVATRKGR